MRGSNYPRWEKLNETTQEMMKYLRCLLDKYQTCGLITEQECEAVFLRYGLNGQGCWTRAELAEWFGVSPSRPYLILAKAMLKLRCQPDFFAGMNEYLQAYRIPQCMWHVAWLKDRGRELREPSPYQQKRYRRKET